MLVSSGERGCLGVGCVVAGGVLPVWLRDAVAQGGTSVGFDVGGRGIVLSGVGVPVSCVAASGSGSGGVRVCVPCARVVFGDSWCSLVLRRWARAAGVDGAKVDALLGSVPGSDSGPVVSGSALSSRGGVVSSGLLFPCLRLFPAVLRPCARLLVVGVLVRGLVLVCVIGVRGLVLVSG